jgi:hypothetical protein
MRTIAPILAFIVHLIYRLTSETEEKIISDPFFIASVVKMKENSHPIAHPPNKKRERERDNKNNSASHCDTHKSKAIEGDANEEVIKKLAEICEKLRKNHNKNSNDLRLNFFASICTKIRNFICSELFVK